MKSGDEMDLIGQKTYMLSEIKDSDNNPILHENDFIPYHTGDYLKRCSIYYISDIHLDEKIAKRFGENNNSIEVEEYIKILADLLIDSVKTELLIRKYLLIAGDVSASFNYSKIFYNRIIERNIIKPQRIIVVLGNHELWNQDKIVDNDVDEIINMYKDFFNEIGITFLYNDLLVINSSQVVIREQELLKMSDSELLSITKESDLSIFGGIGFSAYNYSFNALNGLYLDTITTLNQDKSLTNEFYSLYKKIKKILYERKMIVLTHNPKQDWSDDAYNPNWLYINGHTHRNVYEKNQYMQLYADNQIGYYNEKIKLKRLDYSLKCNIFMDYSDGIHEISLEDYLHFYYKMGYLISCKLKGTFFLLKKKGIYMFLYRNEYGKLYIMNGGKNNKIISNDIEYYYKNMDNYAFIIKEGTKSYYDFINKVSDYIKSIGGSGKIHGTIIDIDYYNHLYINVYDGTITPYWALSIDDKIVYPSLKELISNHCPDLIDNYNKSNSLVSINNSVIPLNGEYYEDTKMYKESRIMRKIQYFIDDNIIRLWNDNLLEDKDIRLLIE